MGGFQSVLAWPFREVGNSSLCACGSYSPRLHTDHCYTNCSLNYTPSSQRLISRRSVGASYHGIGGCNDVTKHAIEMHYQHSSRQFVCLISFAHNDGKTNIISVNCCISCPVFCGRLSAVSFRVDDHGFSSAHLCGGPRKSQTRDAGSGLGHAAKTWMADASWMETAMAM
jgi:hypothetical protein